MIEYTFLTAHTDGRLVSVDGNGTNGQDTVDAFCKSGGWEIEHAAYDGQEAPYYWRLIVTRPHLQSTHSRIGQPVVRRTDAGVLDSCIQDVAHRPAVDEDRLYTGEGVRA